MTLPAAEKGASGAPSHVEEAPAAWPKPAVGWFAVSILMLAYVVSYIDRLIITLLAPQIKADLGLSDTELSLLIGFAFALFYALMGLPIGWMADRHNRKWIVTAGVVLWSAMTALSGVARNFATLFLARMGVGVGEAALGPSAISMIADYFPPEKRARPTGLFTIGGVAGVSAAYILGGIVIGITKANGTVSWGFLGELAPWQQTFLIVAAPGFLVAALMLLVTEPRRREGRTGGGDQSSLRDARRRIAERWPTFRAIYVGSAALYFFVFALMQWAPTMFLRRYGLAEETFGPIFGMFSLVLGVFGTLAATYFADYLRRKGHEDDLMRALFICGLIGAPSMLLAPLMPNMQLCLVAMAPSTFCMMGMMALALTAIQNVVPNRLRGLFSAGFYFTTNIVGLAAGPFVAALITDFVFRDEMKIHLSLITVGLVALPISIWCYYAGMRDYIGAKKDIMNG